MICANCKQKREEHGKTGWCIPLKWHLAEDGEVEVISGLARDVWTPIEAQPSPLARVRQEVEKLIIYNSEENCVDWVDVEKVLAIIDKELEG